MKEKRGIRRFLRLSGMAAVLTAGMAGAKPDKVQAEQMVPEMSVLSAEGNGLDSNTGAAGKVILKQSLKEEELAALKQPELSYTDENGTEYRLADWEVREKLHPGKDGPVSGGRRSGDLAALHRQP